MPVILRSCPWLFLLPVSLAAQGTYFAPGPFPTELNSPAGSSHFSPTLSTDELYVVFASNRPGGLGNYDLYESTRPTTDSAWSTPVHLPGLSSAGADYEPHLAIDGLTLFFVSTRAGGLGASDLWVSTRPNTAAPWGAPGNLGAPVNGPGLANDDPCLTEDQLTLFFTAGGAGGADIWSATRPSIGATFGAPVPFAPANSASFDHSPVVEGNADVVWFSSTRPGGTSGSSDFWMTTRDPVTTLYSAPVGIADLNTTDWDSNAGLGRTTGAMYVSQFSGGLAFIFPVCQQQPRPALPTNPTARLAPTTISTPARVVWRSSYAVGIGAGTAPVIWGGRWIRARPGGRFDALLASLTLLNPPIAATLFVPGGEGAVFLGGATTTLAINVVPPLGLAGLQTYVLGIPNVAALAGLQLHVQEADLDLGPVALAVSQPMTIVLTP